MELIYEIDPVPKARARITKFGAYTPKKTKDFEKYIRQNTICRKFDGPLAIDIVFYIKRPKTVIREYPCVKPDIDNLFKAVTDALNGMAYNDDSQIVKVTTEKAYADKGKIVVKIWKI